MSKRMNGQMLMFCLSPTHDKQNPDSKCMLSWVITSRLCLRCSGRISDRHCSDLVWYSSCQRTLQIE